MQNFTKFFLVAIGFITFHTFTFVNSHSLFASPTLLLEAIDDTVTTTINEPISFNVLQNDTGEEIYVNLTLQPSYGSLAWSVNGDFTYTPNENHVGPDVLVYQIKDNEGNTESANVFITVEGATDLPLQVNVFHECYEPGFYRLWVYVSGGTPPYESFIQYGDDLTNPAYQDYFFFDELFLNEIPTSMGFYVFVRDAENNTVLENHLFEIICHEDVINACIAETHLELTPLITCNEGEKTIEVIATGGSGEYSYSGHFLEHSGDAVIVEDSEGCQNILFYDEVPAYTCPIAVDDVVNGAYNAPFHLKPLLNDIGDDLTISDISGLKHGTIQWKPDQFLAYYPNEGFAGIDTLEYEITDPMGNSSRAKILAVVPENDEVTIFWERDCVEAAETGIYTINFTVAGGKPPYIIDGDFLTSEYRGDEILSFIKVDGDDFTITAIDKDGESTTVQTNELIPCTFLPHPTSDFTVFISCVEGEDYGILTALDPFGEPLQDDFEGNSHGDTIPNSSIYSAHFSEFLEIPFEEIVFCPPIAEDDLYNSHPSYLHLPLTFNPLLNDSGHGLKLVKVESPNYGNVEWWQADGTINYRPNTDFQGVETFDYTLQDIGGNRTSATITLIFAHPTKLKITYERNCFEVNNNGAENYTVNAFVSGGVPPYQVQVNEDAFFEMTENGGAFSFEVPNGEGFQIYAEDNGAVTHTAMVEELEVEACSPLEVWVERDCTHWEETGNYVLNMLVQGGVPPYTISGSTNEVLEEAGATFVIITDGNPYEVIVVDAIGNEYFESGGEIACGSMCAVPTPLFLNDISEIADCTCDGGLIFHFENIEKEESYGVHAVDDSFNSQEIELGDTIQNNTFIDIDYIISSYGCFEVFFDNEQGITGLTSDFCSPETYTLEAIDDFANTLPGEPVSINILQNDSGTNLQVSSILVSPSCGEIVDINPETGAIVYVADADTICSVDTFVYESVDECGNFVEATATIFIIPDEEFIVQVERDCTDAAETGFYTLNILIVGGTLPYTITGTIDTIVHTNTIVSVQIEDGTPYELSIIDADGAEFYELGGEVSCCQLGFLGLALNESESQTSICGADNIVLSLEGGEEETTYHWYLDAEGTVPANPPTGQVWTNDELVGIDTIYVTANDTNGCQSQPLAIETTRYEELKVSNIQTVLSESCLEYQVVFDISGGNGEYTANEIPTSAEFRSDWMAESGEDYSFEIDDNNDIFSCPSILIEGEAPNGDCFLSATEDFVTAMAGETIEIDVLQNDMGYNLSISAILQDPTCGTITNINAETGIITYQANSDTDCNTDYFIYEITDHWGDVTQAGVTISIPKENNELVVEIDADCSNSDITGAYVLNLNISSGVPPFTISGSINEVLEDYGQTFVILDADTPYEIQVTDGQGQEFTASNDQPCFNEELCADLQITPSFDCLITQTQDSIALLSYQTTGGDGNYTFNGNPQNDTLQNGDIYQIEVTDGNGCTASIVDTVDCFFTSIENPNLLTPQIHLFPNPNKGNFTLSLESKQAEMVDIEIIDITGQIQAKTRRHLQGSAKFEREDFNLNLESGLYFIRLSGKDWTWTEKVVVE